MYFMGNTIEIKLRQIIPYNSQIGLEIENNKQGKIKMKQFIMKSNSVLRMYFLFDNLDNIKYSNFSVFC